MIAQLTPSDKRTLIALFFVLTIVQIVDIGQDLSNHQEADKDRAEIRDLIERNNHISDEVIDKLNESSNKSIGFAKIHKEIQIEQNRTLEMLDTLIKNQNNNNNNDTSQK